MEFGGIESSPDYDTLMKAVAVVKANEPETFFILAAVSYTHLTLPTTDVV